MTMIPLAGELGLAQRDHPGAINFQFHGGSPFTAHSDLYEDEFILRMMARVLVRPMKEETLSLPRCLQ
jgi:hypothetical protein